MEWPQGLLHGEGVNRRAEVILYPEPFPYHPDLLGIYCLTA